MQKDMLKNCKTRRNQLQNRFEKKRRRLHVSLSWWQEGSDCTFAAAKEGANLQPGLIPNQNGIAAKTARNLLLCTVDELVFVVSLVALLHTIITPYTSNVVVEGLPSGTVQRWETQRLRKAASNRSILSGFILDLSCIEISPWGSQNPSRCCFASSSQLKFAYPCPPAINPAFSWLPIWTERRQKADIPVASLLHLMHPQALGGAQGALLTIVLDEMICRWEKGWTGNHKTCIWLFWFD